jgi:hypothetical protein
VIFFIPSFSKKFVHFVEGYQHHDFLHVFYDGKNVGTNRKFNKKTHVYLEIHDS